MWLRVVILGALSASTSACGSSESFRERIFDDGNVRYRVGAQTQPFERISVADNDLAWHDARYGTISVNSTCQQFEDVPARALLNHLLIGTTERKFNVEETVTLDGRAAQHVIADVQLDGVPVTVNVYLLVKDGCVYDLTLVATREKLSAAQPLFDAFVRDFAVLTTNVAHERD
ncbi:MAG: hypothetical protein RL701_7962 [Pseudomonadota bacterium]|jgi:hypothetical protein